MSDRNETPRLDPEALRAAQQGYQEHVAAYAENHDPVSHDECLEVAIEVYVDEVARLNRPDNFIEWWDEPERNARLYRHWSCDEGEHPWIVPLDDCSPPTAKDRECARCCLIVPLKARTTG